MKAMVTKYGGVAVQLSVSMTRAQASPRRPISPINTREI